MVNIDYLSGGKHRAGEHRGLSYIGRVDQMSYFISGVVFAGTTRGVVMDIVPVGVPAASVAAEVRSRLVARSIIVRVHELSQPVRGMRSGVTDDDIRRGTFTIFSSKNTKRKILHDSKRVYELTKGIDDVSIAESYARVLSNNERYRRFNRMANREVADALSTVNKKLTSIKNGNSDEELTTPTVVDVLVNLTRCMIAMNRVMSTGTSTAVGVSGASSAAQDYTTSRTSTTQGNSLLTLQPIPISIPAGKGRSTTNLISKGAVYQQGARMRAMIEGLPDPYATPSRKPVAKQVPSDSTTGGAPTATPMVASTTVVGATSGGPAVTARKVSIPAPSATPIPVATPVNAASAITAGVGTSAGAVRVVRRTPLTAAQPAPARSRVEQSSPSPVSSSASTRVVTSTGGAADCRSVAVVNPPRHTMTKILWMTGVVMVLIAVARPTDPMIYPHSLREW